MNIWVLGGNIYDRNWCTSTFGQAVPLVKSYVINIYIFYPMFNTIPLEERKPSLKYRLLHYSLDQIYWYSKNLQNKPFFHTSFPFFFLPFSFLSILLFLLFAFFYFSLFFLFCLFFFCFLPFFSLSLSFSLSLHIYTHFLSFFQKIKTLITGEYADLYPLQKDMTLPQRVEYLVWHKTTSRQLGWTTEMN